MLHRAANSLIDAAGDLWLAKKMLHRAANSLIDAAGDLWLSFFYQDLCLKQPHVLVGWVVEEDGETGTTRSLLIWPTIV